MAINLGETIFKSGYGKLALLYPWRPGNVNVFLLWTDGRNACCLKFLHQRSRTPHPGLKYSARSLIPRTRVSALQSRFSSCGGNVRPTSIDAFSPRVNIFLPPRERSRKRSFNFWRRSCERCAGENSFGIISTSRQECLGQLWHYQTSSVSNPSRRQAISNF